MCLDTPSYDHSDVSQSAWIKPAQYSKHDCSTELTENPDFDCVLMDGAIIPKSSLPSRYQSALGGIDTHIEQMIEMATLGNIWFEEGRPEPNQVAEQLAFKTTKDIFSAYKLIPNAIWASVEGGIMITYWNNKNKCSLKIEVYNDGERAGLVNQNKKILQCNDLTSTTELVLLADTFNR